MAFVVREVDLDRELPLLAKIFNENFAIKGSEARFRWLYHDNPDGRATAWFVLDDRTNAVAGCTSVFPRRFRVRGSSGPVMAWNCGDFCIAPRYRSLGAAVKLRQAARDAVERGASPFLYAHPNDRMLQIHLHVGHQPLGQMVRFARVLRPATGWRLLDTLGAGALRVAGGGFRVQSTHTAEVMAQPPGDEVSALYETLAPKLGTSVVRDATYLRWRFFEEPAGRHEVVTTRLGERLTGYLVFAMNADVVQIKDWLAADAGACDRLFAACVAEAGRRGARSVSAIALESHPDLRRLARLGFVRRPDSYTAVTYASTSYPRRGEIVAPDAWYMTVGDRDI